VLGIIPINSADNVLHVALALLGIISGLISRDARRRDSDALVDRSTPSRFERDQSRERTRR
jgi:hypothetical protein